MRELNKAYCRLSSSFNFQIERIKGIAILQKRSANCGAFRKNTIGKSAISLQPLPLLHPG